MGEIEEIEESEFVATATVATSGNILVEDLLENDDDYEDIDDEEVDEDDEDVFQESFLERIAALSDAIPIELQLGVYSSVKGLSEAAWYMGRFVGKAGWIISTASALLLLPAAFGLERESLAFQQEAMRMPQQAQQSLLDTPSDKKI